METKEIKVNPAEVVLRDEKFGNPISEKLSNYLRKYTGKDDRADVSIATGVGTSTIRNVVFRSNTLTEDNSKAIVVLVNIAMQNCKDAMNEAGEALEDLRELLKET